MTRLSVRQLVLAFLLLPFMVLSSCSRPGEDTTGSTAAGTATPSEQLKVLTTFLPMYLFTQAVAGDAATVEILIPPGTEVHDYQSKPADVQAIAQADVLVKNGLEMETFLESTIRSAENANLQLIDASGGIEPLGEISPVVYPTQHQEDPEHDHESAQDASHSQDDSHDHAADAADVSDADAEHFHNHEQNPHVWLDPVLAIQQVQNIRDGLVAADPNNAPTYEANAAAYIQQLEALDREFQSRLQPFQDRTFVSFHDAFPYLANRYQLQQVAIVALPEDSLAPGDIQRVVAAVKNYQVKALFGEPGVDNKLLQTLSQDLNVKLSALDPMESGELDPQYYFTAMRNNLKALEAAFQ